MSLRYFQSLQRKIILILLALSLVTIMGLFLALDRQASVALEEIEREHGLTGVARVRQELANQHELLRVYAVEYAWWDEIYDRVAQPETFAVFIDDLMLYPEYWSQIDINLMAIFGVDGNYVWGTVASPDKPGDILRMESHLPELLDPMHPLLGLQSPDESKTGMIMGPSGIMLVNSYPILRNDTSGPVRGSLIIGRYLSDKLIESMQERAGVFLKLPLVEQIRRDDHLSSVLNRLSSGTTGQDSLVTVENGQSISYFLLENIDGSPLGLFEVTSNLGVEDIGSAVIRTTLLMILMLIALIIAVEWLLLHRLIIRPVSLLKNHISRINQSGNLSEKIKLSGEDELSSLADEFNELTDKLERSNKQLKEARDLALQTAHSKSQFLATMSHEIRTPMNGVLGMAELMWGTRLDENQQDLTRNIITSGQHLLTVINDILDYTKIETGNLSLENEPFDLCEMVEETAGLLVIHAHSKNLELMLEFRGEPDNLLIGDRNRISQILVNLIGNAIKFTNEGDVRVTVTVDEAQEAQQQVLMEVRDTGIGIPQEVQCAIFEEFQQVDKGASRQFEGTGLGLSICRSLLQLMGSDIQLESEPGVGSIFWFTLSLPVSSILVPAAPGYGSLVGKRALVIDDNEMNLSILGKQLEQWEMTYQLLKFGGLAIECLQSARDGGKEFDLILLDWHMPGVSGLDVVRQVRASPLFKDIPVMMLSSASTGLEKEQAEAASVDSFVTKPIRRWQLLSRLKELLNAQSPAGKQEPSQSALTNQRGYDARILLVEDNLLNQQVARAMLEKIGCRVTVSPNGADAIEMIRLLPFDLVLMDLHMPVMDGFEATRRIRELGSSLGSEIPIVALTADVLEEVRERCLASGMNDFLPKPVSIQQLTETLGKWLKRTVNSDAERHAASSSNVASAPQENSS